MKARDVMTRGVVSIRPDASILEAAHLMLEHGISGLPVIDEAGSLVGIVTERDLLRRNTADAQLRRPEWVEFLIGPERLALEYAESRTRKVNEVMTANLITISEAEPIEKAVRLMDEHRIKRLLVMRDGKLVGIIARPDLVRAFAHGFIKAPSREDAGSQRRMVEMEKQYWTNRTKPSA